MMFNKKDWPLWLVLVFFAAASFVIYPYLPEQVPSHWNLQGEVDSYASRAFGAFFGPGLAIGLYVLMLVTPKIDPKGANFTRYGKSWDVIRWLVVLIMLGISVITWLAALEIVASVGKYVLALVSLTLIVIGNYLPKIKYQNYTLGIRNPWTLDNELVWRDTHRFAGLFMVLGGLLGLSGLFFSDKVAFVLLMIGALVPSLGSFVYSYLRYSQLKKLG